MSIRIREQRELRGWTQEQLAEEIDQLCDDNVQRRGLTDRKMISKWECGKHPPSKYYQSKLCTLFGMTAQELGFIQSSTLPLYEISIGDDMDSKRRQLLKLLGTAGTALALPADVDMEHVADAIVHPSYQNAALMENLTAINRHQWAVYRASSQKFSMIDAVLGQLDVLIQLLKDAFSHQHQRLCVLISDLSQLAGEIFFDINDQVSAQACYNLAASIARDAKHSDLWACALVRLSFLSIHDDPPRYPHAISLLQGAEYVARNGDSGLVTRYWIAAVMAEAQSGTQNLTVCQQYLDLAEKVTGISNNAWLRFDSDRLQELRGACFVRLEQPDLALPILHEALKESANTGRRRAMIFIDLARASLQNQGIEESCSYASQAIRLGTSGFVRKGILGLRTQLTRYADTAAVKQLDKQFVSLKERTR